MLTGVPLRSPATRAPQLRCRGPAAWLVCLVALAQLGALVRAGDTAIDYAALEPEAIVWAKPLAGPKLRVLFLCTQQVSAEAGAIAHRVDMDYAVATMAAPGQWGGGPRQRAAWLSVLEQDFDVCVFGLRVSPDMIKDDEVRYHLMRKIVGGMGVVTLWHWNWPFPESVIRRDSGKRGQDSFPGIPIGLGFFERLIADPASQAPALDAQGHDVPAGYRRVIWQELEQGLISAQVGQTRMVRIPFVESGGVVRQGFVSGGDLTPDMAVYDEYCISLLGKAILWAARREPAARLSPIPLQQATLKLGADLPTTVSVSVLAHDTIAGELACVIRDADTRAIVQERRLPLQAAAGARVATPIDLPRLGAGNYLLDVWLRRDHQTVDWASGSFHVVHPARIVAVRFTETVHERGAPIAGNIELAEVPPDAQLHLQVLDSWGRLLAEQRLAAANGVVPFTLRLDPAVNGIAFRLSVELHQAGTRLSRAAVDFPIRRAPPGFLYNLCLAEDQGSSHAMRLRRRTLRPWRSDGDNYCNTAFAAATLALDQLEPNAFPYRVGYSFGHDLPQVLATVRGTVQQLVPYGLRFVNLGDDSFIAPGQEVAPPDAAGPLPARAFLEAKYQNLDGLNAAWRTRLGAWGEITRAWVAAQQAQGNFAPVAELSAFSEEAYMETIRQIRDEVAIVSPDVAVGQYASYLTGHLGRALETMTYLAPYYRDEADIEILGAFHGKAKGYYGANGGYPGNALEPWYTLLCGGNLVSNWYSPERLRGDLTLVDGNRAFNESAAEIKRGIGKQLALATLRHDAVAILYSGPSFLASSLHARMAETQGSCASFNALCHDAGLQYLYVSEQHLRQGVLKQEGIRLLMLPYCQALDDETAAVIRSFVETGGTVLADLRPAVFDQLSRPRALGALDEVFGITRQAVAEDGTVGELVLTTSLADLVAHAPVATTVADRSVHPAGATAYGQVDGVPALLVNPYGRGRACLLNVFVGQYRDLRERGQAAQFTAVFRALVRQAGIVPDRVGAVAEGGPAMAFRRVLFTQGTMQVLGVCKRDLPCERYPQQIRLRLPEQRHVYEMRNGQYRGFASQVDDPFGGDSVRLYALLPYRVARLALHLPDQPRRGATLRGEILLVTEGTAAPAAHVVRLRVKGPAGEFLECFEQELVVAGGEGTFALPIALQEPPGIYQIVADDIPTGTGAHLAFTLE